MARDSDLTTFMGNLSTLEEAACSSEYCLQHDKDCLGLDVLTPKDSSPRLSSVTLQTINRWSILLN